MCDRGSGFDSPLHRQEVEETLFGMRARGNATGETSTRHGRQQLVTCLSNELAHSRHKHVRAKLGQTRQKGVRGRAEQTRKAALESLPVDNSWFLRVRLKSAPANFALLPRHPPVVLERERSANRLKAPPSSFSATGQQVMIAWRVRDGRAWPASRGNNDIIGT